MVDAGVHQAPLFHHLTATNGPHGLRHIFILNHLNLHLALVALAENKLKWAIAVNCSLLQTFLRILENQGYQEENITPNLHTLVYIHTYIQIWRNIDMYTVFHPSRHYTIT
jgi:hypothetical protein